MSRTFLSAEWRHLAMVNYRIDPAVLQPLLPAGTELDTYGGESYVSMVGFRFLKTRVLGVPIPLHQNFEEVNLRFYVRAKGPEGWRRGVVFIREMVPRFAIAWVARVVYGEPYLALPMRHTWNDSAEGFTARYEWRREGRWEFLEVSGTGAPEAMAGGSLPEFIAEHYWGYTTGRASSTQYQVEHPRWRVRPVERTLFQAEVASLYGPQFVESLSAAPSSAFLAEGSPVVVRMHSAMATLP